MNGGDDLGLGVMVSMKDAFSNNSARVESSMRSLDSTVAASSENIQKNMDRIQKGAMTMGAGLAMMALPLGLVASTAATQKALGELKSLGVQDLQALEDAAESFTNQWSGTTKAEFISASYDVRSAISTLSDEAVGTLTAMAALTAKATKATTEEMVGTFTTGYGIFKPLMKDLSDEQWAKTFAGAMAQTVASFKTNGKQMADAIKNIGAVAAANNVPLEEQLAILGQLQTTMPGSEAGTLYKAFIMKAAEAGEALGLDFLNSQGQLKGVLGMMDEIKKKFPDLSKAAAQVEIKKAFGSDEAVKFLLQMSQGTEALEGNIKTIQGAMKTGTAVTEKMAEAMNMDIGSQFAVLGQQIRNLSEIMGRTLLPVVTPIIQGLSKVILFFQKVAKSVPGLTRVVLMLSMALGAVLLVAGGVIAAAGTIGIMLPAIKAGLLAMAGSVASVGGAIATWFLPVTAIIAGVVLAVYFLKRAWGSDFAGIRSMVTGAFQKIGLVFQGIKALIGSLSGGSASMSADLAKKLEAAGLMGLVTTVFRIYYRVREFMAGLWNAFSSAFGKIRKMLGPAVSVLVDAFAGLWKALFSIFEAFGLVSTAADGSAFRGFGQVLGTVMGVMAQVAGFMLRNLAYGFATIAYLITPIIKAVVWLVKVIVQGAVLAAKFLYKFFLPLRLLVQGFKMVAKVAYALWQMITGDISVTDGFKKIGGAVFDFLATPFLWVRDVVMGVWNGLKWTFTAIGNFLKAAGNLMVSAFMNFPLVRMFRNMFSTIGQYLNGEIDFYECGKRILLTIGEGILSTLMYPFTLVKKAFSWVRKLLPFSDAQTGPLSSLTDSGAAILKTLGKGMMAVIKLPAQLLGTAFKGMMKAASWVWGGLKKIGSGILSAVAAPFKAGAELAGKAWEGIRGVASSAWSDMKSASSTAWGWMKSGFSGLASVAAGAWDGIKNGAVAAWDGIKSAVSSVGSWLKAPLEGLSSFASGVWSNMKSLASSAWSSITGFASSAWDGMKYMAASAGDWLRQPFDALSNVAAPAWEKMKDFASGAWEGMKTKMSEVAASAYDSGKAILSTVGRGISAVIDDPYGAMKTGPSKLRNLLPFSDAKEGPLSSLTKSGMALLQTFGAGIEKTAKLPGQAVEGAFGFLGGLGKKLIPPTLAGALGLSPMLAGEIPQPAADLALTPSLTAGIPTPTSDLQLKPSVSTPVPPQSASLVLSPPPAQTVRVKPTLAANWPAPQMAALPALPSAAHMIQTERNGLPTIPDAPQRITPELSGPLPPANLGINALMPSLQLPELGAKVRPMLDAIPNQDFGLLPKLQGALPELTAPLNYSGKLNSSISGQLDLPTIPDKVLGLIPRLRESIPDLQGQLKLPELGEQALGLNPIMSALPDFSLPDLPLLKAPETIPPVQMPEHQSQLLAETRGSLAQTLTPESPRREGDSKNDSGLLGAILEKLEGLSERPISVQLTTQLDGRQIAQSVYKDIREQKVKNYGTLH